MHAFECNTLSSPLINNGLICLDYEAGKRRIRTQIVKEKNEANIVGKAERKKEKRKKEETIMHYIKYLFKNIN